MHDFETSCLSYWENISLQSYADFYLMKHFIIQNGKQNKTKQMFITSTPSQDGVIGSRYILPLKTSEVQVKYIKQQM